MTLKVLLEEEEGEHNNVVMPVCSILQMSSRLGGTLLPETQLHHNYIFKYVTLLFVIKYTC